MQNLRKIFEYTISYKMLLILLLVVFCLLIFPLLYVGKWNVPCADDYSFGYRVHDAVMNNGSLKDILQGAAESVKDAYFSTQGSAAAVFLFALMPASFGEQYYAFVPYIMLTALTVGVCFFIHTLFSIFSAEKHQHFIIALSLLIACTQFLPSPVQAFYWYNGSLYYTFFFGISLILYGLIIRVARTPEGKGSAGKQILICLLCVLIAFCNYITSLVTAILLISMLGLLILTKNKRWKNLILPILLFGAAFFVNISAPGLDHRQTLAPEQVGIVKAVRESFVLAITQISTWNRIPVLALYLLLCPLLWKTASGSAYSFKYPWLVSLYSFCLFAAMDAPTLYGGIEATPGRVENIRYYAMLILFVINIFYWFGWLSKNSLKYIGKNKFRLSLGYLAGIVFIFLVGTINYPSYRITSYSALQSYKLGQIGMYKHIYNQRLEILENPEITDAVLREYPRKKPFILFFDDITEHPDDWRNQAMARYYHKNTVRLRTEEEAEQLSGAGTD